MEIKEKSIFDCTDRLITRLDKGLSYSCIKDIFTSDKYITKFTDKEFRDAIALALKTSENLRASKRARMKILDYNKSKISILFKKYTTKKEVLVILNKCDKLSNLTITDLTTWIGRYEGGISSIKKDVYNLKSYTSEYPITKSCYSKLMFRKEFILENLDMSLNDIADLLQKKYRVFVDEAQLSVFLRQEGIHKTKAKNTNPVSEKLIKESIYNRKHPNIYSGASWIAKSNNRKDHVSTITNRRLEVK